MNKSPILVIICALSLAAPAIAQASVIEFHFTGQATVITSDGEQVVDQVPIGSTLTYNTATGIGESTGLFVAPFSFFGADATFYDVSMQKIDDTNLILGNMLVDWAGATGIPVSLVWDASGMFNAIDYGLQAGDVISGTQLIRNGSVIDNVGSATPASDGLVDSSGNILNQGPAPIAMTTLNTTTICTPYSDGIIKTPGTCMQNPVTGAAPFTDDGIGGSPLVDGPFVGMNVNLDIGSGHSLTVLNISTVPIPAAIWLFGSGLLGLIGTARRK